MAEERLSKAELLGHIERGWNDLHTYLKTLTPEQMTTPIDAAGWTAKDHVLHLAVWEDGVEALMRGQNRRQQMGIDVETWKSRDFEAINAIIQQRDQALSLDAVYAHFQAVHQRMMQTLSSFSDDDLYRPVNTFHPESTGEYSIIELIMADTFEHYDEHLPWIRAIVEP